MVNRNDPGGWKGFGHWRLYGSERAYRRRLSGHNLGPGDGPLDKRCQCGRSTLVSFQCSSAERRNGVNWRRRRSGPLTNLNAEIYYPPYLYKNDGSGQPAIRPVITPPQPSLSFTGDIAINITVGPPTRYHASHSSEWVRRRTVIIPISASSICPSSKPVIY